MENVALIPFLLNAGAEITICEQWEKDVPATVPAEVSRRTGPDHLSGLDTFDYIFRSPGLPIARIDAALAGAAHQPVRTSPMDFFLSLGLGTTIGVTGTKGKGTTSTMLGAMLAEAGKDVIVAGNIGEVIFEHLGRITKETIVVMELSSFQLEDMRHSPDVAVLLPITSDHLQPLSDRSPNYHSSQATYVEAKANICAYQQPTDLLVFAADSEAAQEIAAPATARKISVGSGADADLVLTSAGQVTSQGQLLIDLAATGLRGSHIFLDAAIAAAVAREFEVTTSQIASALQKYQPLPHRLQTVGTIEGITYIDDSYATAPDATAAAIQAFSQPIIWIGGGSRKGADFTELGQAVRNSTIKAVVLLGQEAERMQAVLPTSLPVTVVDSMAKAVTVAKKQAAAGDVVLLSPACASTDMFKNAADRGDQFQVAVAPTGLNNE